MMAGNRSTLAKLSDHFEHVGMRGNHRVYKCRYCTAEVDSETRAQHLWMNHRKLYNSFRKKKTVNNDGDV